MTGLHTRGYRPEPGERVHFAGMRDVWEDCWNEARAGSVLSAFQGFVDVLALECLEAREGPGPARLGPSPWRPREAVVSIAEDVEARGRATPGVHWGADEDGDPEPYLDGTVGDVLVWPESDGRYSVQVWGPPPLLERRVTAPELGLLLRCVASGLEVDLPCSDCEGSKVETCTRSANVDELAAPKWSDVTANLRAEGWTWTEAPVYPHMPRGPHRLECERPCPTCSEPGPEVECGACKGRGGWQRPSSWDGCRACDSAGKRPGPGVPTGRETVGLAAAWMRGRPIRCDHCEPDPKALKITCSECGVWASPTDPTCPGDPSTREALAVLADKWQSEGDPLGELLALDLAGAACPAGCSGWSLVDGEWENVEGLGDVRMIEVSGSMAECDACEGHGTALAQRLRQLGTDAHPAASLTAAAGA